MGVIKISSLVLKEFTMNVRGERKVVQNSDRMHDRVSEIKSRNLPKILTTDVSQNETTLPRIFISLSSFTPLVAFLRPTWIS